MRNWEKKAMPDPCRLALGQLWPRPAIAKIDNDSFNDLWCYIWSKLELCDCDSQAMARRLNDQGIFTWEQWADLEFPAA